MQPRAKAKPMTVMAAITAILTHHFDIKR